VSLTRRDERVLDTEMKFEVPRAQPHPAAGCEKWAGGPRNTRDIRRTDIVW
jgi:hypothetical protein